jgi:hypothetical protein
MCAWSHQLRCEVGRVGACMARRSLSTSLGTGSNSSAHAPRCSVALRASSTSTCRGTSSVCPPCGSAAALPPIHRTSHVSSCVVQVTSRCDRREVRTSLISGQATSRWSGWPMRCVPTRSWRSSRSLRIRSPSKASPLARPTPLAPVPPTQSASVRATCRGGCTRKGPGARTRSAQAVGPVGQSSARPRSAADPFGCTH